MSASALCSWKISSLPVKLWREYADKKAREWESRGWGGIEARLGPLAGSEGDSRRMVREELGI